ncbi:MAG: hypothetical protein AAF533_08300 [Acidobacteriota bacterium]
MTRHFSRLLVAGSLLGLLVASTASAGRTAIRFELLNDANLADTDPGPSDVYRGDRLTGTDDDLAPADEAPAQETILLPNEFGSFSFAISPLLPQPFADMPFINFGPSAVGVGYLGGPRLDLDGDAAPPRSFVPVLDEMGDAVTPAILPGIGSYLTLSLGDSDVEVVEMDITRTSDVGLQDFGVGVGVLGDDRAAGSLSSTAFGQRIDGLFFEWYEDDISANASGAAWLGAFQRFGNYDGWIIERDGSGDFPTLAGLGLSSRFPDANPGDVGTVAARVPESLFGPVAVIEGLEFVVPPVPVPPATPRGADLAGLGGDFGLYIDTVVAPAVPDDCDYILVLQSVGYGINNTFDPVFGSTIGYDDVFFAAGKNAGSISGGTCDGGGFEGVANGEIVTNQFAGVSISGSGDVVAFDTSMVQCDDVDLLTAGQGNGNDVPRGTVLVVQEADSSCVPDDAADGGTILFSFETAQPVAWVGIVDADENGGSIIARNAAGAEVANVAIPSNGDNSWQRVDVNANDVVELEVNLAGSGGVSEIECNGSRVNRLDPEPVGGLGSKVEIDAPEQQIRPDALQGRDLLERRLNRRR